MISLLEQVIQLISQPGGSMAYHLVISSYLISVISPGLGFSLSNLNTKSKRILLGLCLLILSRLFLFVASGLATQGLVQIDTILPVLDRVVNTFNLVIIIWLWVFDEPDRRGDIGTIIVAILTLMIGIAFTFYWASEGIPNTLNKSGLATLWGIYTSIILFVGEVLLFICKTKERNQSMVMLWIIFFGELIQLIYPDTNSDYPNIARLAYITAFPLLLGLAHRFLPEPPPAPILTPPVATPTHVQPPPETIIQEAPTPRIEYKENGAKRGIDIKMFLATMALASVTDPREICQLLTMYTAHAMVADICLLLSVPDEKDQVHLICGYDLIVEESLSSTTFDHRLIPGYQNAIQEGKPVQISEKDQENLFAFADRLNLDELGNFLAYPISNRDNQLLASLVFVTPYSKYNWKDTDIKFLSDSSPAIGDVLQRAWGGEQSPEMTSQFADTMQTLEAEKNRLLEENEALAAELAILAVQTEQPAGNSEELENASAAIKALETENVELKQQLESLAQSNQELTAQASNGNIEKIEQDLENALGQVSRLQTELSQANQKLNQVAEVQEQSNNGGTLSDEQAEVIASIAQELRQPMSSISGYTDLLISESVGILGALQKKFLERVKASTDRMNRLIGDLIQITTLESGSLEISVQAFNLVEVIDLAIEMTSAQFREKNIILRVDLPPDLPNVQSDKDALQQIITHLLQNAGAATPNEGEIFLKAELSPNSDDEVILIEVSDSGEGIPKEDLPRVFSRLYRADNPLIQGVGDTGVGLSIAKTLTEALGGRIWVESELEVGSTFSVLLPVASLTAESSGG